MPRDVPQPNKLQAQTTKGGEPQPFPEEMPRDGPQSAQLPTVQGDVQKSEWKGRSSFNKHTGSLSNNVITDASLVEISQPDLSPKSSTEHRRPAHGAASKMNVQEMIKCADDVKNECDLSIM